jgi:hypothetical protein
MIRRKDRIVTVSAADGAVLDWQRPSIGVATGRVFRQNPISTANLESLPLPDLTSATSLTAVYAKVYSYYPNLAFLLPVKRYAAQGSEADGDAQVVYRISGSSTQAGAYIRVER